LPKAWVKERHRDYYYRKAKKEQYRSRAAYKLLQAVKRYAFIKSGDVVVDLGAAPGGWTQAARELVGSDGFVLGIDINRIKPMSLSNIQTIVGDISDPQIVKQIMKLLPHPADTVVSDVSPNISGIWELDHARQIDLARKSLQIATSILKPKGSFFVKVFQGDMLNDFAKEVKQNFGVVRIVKPAASRKKSSELYILGIQLKKK
jgi:23S rRNA (uridine2552-2'-O)-methyltransferase